MSLQTIFDKAQMIEFDRRRIVSQTITRSQRIKTSERATAQPWRFIVTPPGALPWVQGRTIVETITTADRVTESEIKISNSQGLNWITDYQGELTTAQRANLMITATNTSSVIISGIPSIGDTLTSRTVSVAAETITGSTDYNRAFKTTRNDFLITNNQFDSNFYSIRIGDSLSTATHVTSSQTISSITRDYITGYTRIVMSANADADSALNTAIDISISKTTTVNSATSVFKVGDIIQPNNSRYPYAVIEDVVIGSTTTVTVSLHRPIITSENITITGENLKIGSSCTWRLVATGLPTYQIMPGRYVQYTGNFELVEKII